MLGGAKAAAAANPPAAKRRRRVPSGASSSSTLSSSFLGASESDTSCVLLTALGLILTEKADARLEQQRVLATERRAVHLILVTESEKKINGRGEASEAAYYAFIYFDDPHQLRSGD